MRQFSFRCSHPITAVHAQGIYCAYRDVVEKTVPAEKSTAHTRSHRKALNGLYGLCDALALLCMGSSTKRRYGRFTAFGGAYD